MINKCGVKSTFCGEVEEQQESKVPENETEVSNLNKLF